MYPDGFSDHQLIDKTEAPGANTAVSCLTPLVLRINKYDPQTQTPVVNVAVDLLYAMTNISALLGTDWYFGLPFNNTLNDTGIATVVALVEEVLGSHLLALQLGEQILK